MFRVMSVRFVLFSAFSACCRNRSASSPYRVGIERIAMAILSTSIINLSFVGSAKLAIISHTGNFVVNKSGDARVDAPPAYGRCASGCYLIMTLRTCVPCFTITRPCAASALTRRPSMV